MTGIHAFLFKYSFWTQITTIIYNLNKKHISKRGLNRNHVAYSTCVAWHADNFPQLSTSKESLTGMMNSNVKKPTAHTGDEQKSCRFVTPGRSKCQGIYSLPLSQGWNLEQWKYDSIAPIVHSGEQCRRVCILCMSTIIYTTIN